MVRRNVFLIACIIAGSPAKSQITTTLEPGTVHAFEAYARGVERELQLRWHGQKPFLSLDENPDAREKVMTGEIFIWPGAASNPIPVADGLIHDWTGAMFIPNASIQKVLSVLQDFDAHSRIYPEIVKSRLLRREGNDITGFWRIERKQGFLTIDLDVIDKAHYQAIAPDKWICRAYADDITEVQNAGSPSERKFPPGEGSGFLWRLYGYWSLQSSRGGVLAECRTLSLSRSIPGAVAWMIRPLVQKLPRESLAATLENTKTAVTKR